MSTPEEKGIAVIAGIGVVFIVVMIDIPIMIYRGFVLSKLWEWFFVPLGLPKIGIAWAIGIALSFGLLFSALAKSSEIDKDKGTADKILSAIYQSLLTSSLVWGLGYIVKGFM